MSKDFRGAIWVLNDFLLTYFKEQLRWPVFLLHTDSILIWDFRKYILYLCISILLISSSPMSCKICKICKKTTI